MPYYVFGCKLPQIIKVRGVKGRGGAVSSKRKAKSFLLAMLNV